MYLFVYGTLQEGQRNNHYLHDCRFIRPARTLPCYRLFDNGYFPMMIRSHKGYSVYGEIWKVEEEDTIEELDEHEACYIRRPIRVENFNRRIYAYIYKYKVRASEECYGQWP